MEENLKETFFMSPERLEKEIYFFIKNKSFFTKTDDKLESLSDVYIFQPAFIEVIDTLKKKEYDNKINQLISELKEFIEKSPYRIENKEELLWALELWNMSLKISFTKMLNTAKARKNKIHSVLR